MTATLQTRTNPYVGPRAFQQGEKLYGRDLEVMQLLHVLMAERIVLFYSPSGAGKTSLIQAALIPRLEEEGFHVLPSMRVSLGPSADEEVDSFSNRYVFGLLLSLEEALPPEQRIPLAELSALTLGEYLDRRQDGGEAVGTVLIFDQFEEILTLDPIDREVKLEFFAQVGAALRDRRRWALFAMREEFIAGLEDPYLRPIPTRLRTSYRLGLLAPQSAKQAIQEPAKAAGVTFTDAAAAKLVRDLSMVRVLQPDGSVEKRPGPYVEPVQLQVVCRRLWDLLPEGASQIVEEDIGLLADVDLALSGYYDDQVKAALSGYFADQVKAAHNPLARFGVYLKRAVAAAEDIGVPALGVAVAEGTIRNWFDGKLITEQGIRNQVLEGPQESEGLDNRAIQPLVGAHLVRAERRRGATWFELAHDRLIEPVQASNAAWRRARLTRWLAVGATLMSILVIVLACLFGWKSKKANDNATSATNAAIAIAAAQGMASAAEDTAVAAQMTVAELKTQVASCAVTDTPAPPPPPTTAPPPPPLTPTDTRTPPLTPTDTRTPTLTPTPVCPFEAKGPFAGLWQRYRNQLGCPKPEYETPEAIDDAEQAFQNGRMIWRADTKERLAVIYVIYEYEPGDRAGKYQKLAGGAWESDGSDCSSPCEASPPQGLFAPVQGFLDAWCKLCAGDAPIGWGLAGERGFGPDNGDPLVQEFDGGLILRDGERRIYVLFNDWTFVRIR